MAGCELAVRVAERALVDAWVASGIVVCVVLGLACEKAPNLAIVGLLFIVLARWRRRSLTFLACCRALVATGDKLRGVLAITTGFLTA